MKIEFNDDEIIMLLNSLNLYIENEYSKVKSEQTVKNIMNYEKILLKIKASKLNEE